MLFKIAHFRPKVSKSAALALLGRHFCLHYRQTAVVPRSLTCCINLITHLRPAGGAPSRNYARRTPGAASPLFYVNRPASAITPGPLPRSRLNRRAAARPVTSSLFFITYNNIMIIQEFTVLPGQTEKTFRVQKSTQELLISRTGKLSILALGMLLGLPEKISTEITHPVRKRVTQADREPLSHIAAWAQFGRGPIVETAPASGLAEVGFGTAEAVGGAVVKTQTRYYINQSGPLEIDTDDQFNVTISGLVVGSTYVIESPEMPVQPAYSQMLYNYNISRILENDRQKSIATGGCVGLVLPNDPLTIERVVMTIQVDENTTKDCTWSLNELLSVQSDANPNVAVMTYTSPNANARGSVSVPSGTSDLLVVSLNHVRSIEIHTTLGRTLDYTLISVQGRA